MTEHEDEKYKYYVYKCTHTTETRGKRTTIKTKEPCGKWKMLQTSRIVTEESNHQARCSCGFRPRLNPANTELMESHWHAHTEMTNRNKLQGSWS